MRHFVEIWTHHRDETVTLVRESVTSKMVAQFRISFLSAHMEPCNCCSDECEDRINDFGEHVSMEHTNYAAGVVNAGVFQFANGE